MDYRTILLLLLLPFTSDANNLQEALFKNHVSAEFLSMGGHRNNCIKLKIENKLNTTTKINIPVGLQLSNADSTRQDMIIVKNELLVLQPNEKREVKLKGFCSKQRRGSPRRNDAFTLQKIIDPKITALCNLISELQEFEYSGQQAIWSLVGDTDPNYIVGADSTNTMLLRKFVGKALGKKVKPFIWTTYNRPAIISEQALRIKSEGNHYIRQVKANDLIEYAIYNDSDSAVSKIRAERVVANRWNKHNCIWKFEVEALNPTKKYYMRIKVNGTIQKEWLYYFWG